MTISSTIILCLAGLTTFLNVDQAVSTVTLFGKNSEWRDIVPVSAKAGMMLLNIGVVILTVVSLVNMFKSSGTAVEFPIWMIIAGALSLAASFKIKDFYRRKAGKKHKKYENRK